MSSTLNITASGSILLINPERTLPGPVSTNVFIPELTIVLIESSHKTGLLSCFTSDAFILSTVSRNIASALLTTGIEGHSFLYFQVDKNSESALEAFSIRAQCDGALTASGIALFAPASFQELHSLFNCFFLA